MVLNLGVMPSLSCPLDVVLRFQQCSADLANVLVERRERVFHVSLAGLVAVLEQGGFAGLSTRTYRIHERTVERRVEGAHLGLVPILSCPSQGFTIPPASRARWGSVSVDLDMLRVSLDSDVKLLGEDVQEVSGAGETGDYDKAQRVESRVALGESVHALGGLLEVGGVG